MASHLPRTCAVVLAYADAVATYLAFAVSKLADWSSTLCTFIPGYGKFGHTLGKQMISMVWDYSELNVFGQRVGNWSNHVEWIADCLDALPLGLCGRVANLDAAAETREFRPSNGYILCTDPPYYDNVGYADLSDFFY